MIVKCTVQERRTALAMNPSAWRHHARQTEKAHSHFSAAIVSCFSARPQVCRLSWMARHVTPQASPRIGGLVWAGPHHSQPEPQTCSPFPTSA